MNKLIVGATFLVAVTAALFVAGMLRVPALMLIVAAAVVSVWLQLASPSFWMRLRRIRSDTAPVLPDPLECSDPVIAGLVLRLTRGRQARDRAVARSPFGRQHALASRQRLLADLERRALVVTARAEYVRGFLRELAESGASLEGEVARLRAAEQEAPSAEASRAYGQAATTSSQRREAVRRIEAQGAALVGTLEHLVALLETVPAKLTESELLRIDEGDRLIGVNTSDAEEELAQLGASFVAASGDSSQ